MASVAPAPPQPRPPTAAALRSLPPRMVALEDRPGDPAPPPAILFTPTANNTEATNPPPAAPGSTWWERLRQLMPCRSHRVDVPLQ
ncbi:unnamed protein product [Caenorhabditis brenneri]